MEQLSLVDRGETDSKLSVYEFFKRWGMNDTILSDIYAKFGNAPDDYNSNEQYAKQWLRNRFKDGMSLQAIGFKPEVAEHWNQFLGDEWDEFTIAEFSIRTVVIQPPLHEFESYPENEFTKWRPSSQSESIPNRRIVRVQTLNSAEFFEDPFNQEEEEEKLGSE